MEMIKVSAPGKIHLIGEHSVVYGKPAIIAALGLRCYVDAKKSDNVIFESKDFGDAEYSTEEVFDAEKKATELWTKGRSKGNFSDLFSYYKTDRIMPLMIATGTALKKARAKSGINLKIKSEIPIGSGLGSSSAMAVTISKAVTEVYGRKITAEDLNGMAFDIEKFNHGNPSGGDNSACCYGGFIWFQRGSPRNLISPFFSSAPEILGKFVLVNMGRPEKTTGELVQAVRDLPEDYRNIRTSVLGRLAYEMKQTLENRDVDRIAGIINRAQQILSELGVSTEKIDKLVLGVKEVGGAAKLCGAGGGGTVLCFHKNKEELKRTIRGMGHEPQDVELGVEGVRTEKL